MQRNEKTGKRRVAWADLDAAGRQRRYRQALQALKNGLRGSNLLGTRTATKMLVEIAAAKSISLKELRARTGTKGSAFDKTAERILALGLVYRERRRVRGRRKKSACISG